MANWTIEDYIEAKRLGMPYTGHGNSPGTLVTYERALMRLERYAGKPLADITPDDLQSILEAMEAAGISDNTKNHLKTIAAQAFEWAIGTDKYDEKNPFKALPRRRVEREVKPALEPEEVQRLLDALDTVEREKFERVPEGSVVRNTRWFQDGPTGKNRLIAELQAYGALRIGEALGLKKVDVLTDGIRVRGKGGKWRLVPIPQETMEKLRAYVKAHPYTEYVFYGESGRAFGVDQGKPMKEATYYIAFNAALEKAGLDPSLTPHILRHTAATRVQEAVGDLAVTQDFLGHASPTTTRIYVRVANTKVKAACAAAFGK